jgi:uncharacterized repeat protein (TIGR03837 family)
LRASVAPRPVSHNTAMRAPPIWDIFCKVIDNYGDIGVCWRLACGLAERGHTVRLWADDATALAWMAPQGRAGVEVKSWADTAGYTPGDVLIEAFGCDAAPEIIAAYAMFYWAKRPKSHHKPVWINLEYLSAEPYVQRSHALPSPVMSGPAQGMTKWFFYPGFTSGTGGLLREADLLTRQAQFNRHDWLARQGLGDAQANPQANLQPETTSQAAEQFVSLFCYEPAALRPWLQQLASGPQRSTLLVTPGRAAAAVKTCLQADFLCQIANKPNEIGHEQLLFSEHLVIHYLPAYSQTDYDHLLWSCDLNMVRGEDSVVRALWAGKPFIWHIYPQADGAHAAKLNAFLDWLQAPDDVRLFHQVWNGLSSQPLPAIDFTAYAAVVQSARQRLLAQNDLVTQLVDFVAAKSRAA